jgi:hypothetical protein
MKTINLFRIASLPLIALAFSACQKNVQELTAEPEFISTSHLSENSTECPSCVTDFNSTTSTVSTNAVYTPSGNSFNYLGTTVTTVANTSQIYTVGNVIVTVSHDANNIYYTLKRDNETGGFESFRFLSPAVDPVPTTGEGRQELGSVYKTIQIVKSRASLAACNSTTFSFNVRGGGNSTVGGDVTSGTLTYVLRDLCSTSSCTTRTETAFGGETTGGGNAWWFAFDAGDATQDIIAGQNEVIGTVHYNGSELTITLNSGWSLQNVSEPVKIQGYYELPSVRPAAGQFTTYKGSSLVVPVDGFDYYVIHLDVEICE